MKAIWLVTLLIIGLISFSFATQIYAQHEHAGEKMEADAEKSDHSMHDMGSDKLKANSDKARCAYEGMVMKKAMLVPMKHGEETLYFCNEEQKAMFQKSPKRLLKKMTVGHSKFLMNVLTTKEYMDMMGKMAKKGNANDTHWLSVYLAGEHEMKLPGLAVKVVSASGKTKFQGLKYNKMLKTYTGRVSLLDSGEHKLSLLMESGEVVMP